MRGGGKVATGGKALRVGSSPETCLCICEAHQLVKGFAVWGGVVKGSRWQWHGGVAVLIFHVQRRSGRGGGACRFACRPRRVCVPLERSARGRGGTEHLRCCFCACSSSVQRKMVGKRVGWLFGSLNFSNICSDRRTGTGLTTHAVSRRRRTPDDGGRRTDDDGRRRTRTEDE